MKGAIARMNQAVAHACAELRTAATVGEDEHILDEEEAAETRANAERLQGCWGDLKRKLGAS